MDIKKTDELISSVWLTLALGVSNPAISSLINRYRTAQQSRFALCDKEDPEAAAIAGEYHDRISKTAVSQCEKIIDDCIKNGIGTLICYDENYPEALQYIDNPPAVLYYKGDISEINSKVLFSVVGTREPSEYSRSVAKAVSKSLALCGFHIVSGFAAGIDITSQTAAASAGGKTYAVMGCGIDYNYPKCNFQYRDLILSHGGFLSEYPPGTRPGYNTFPPRNRIIAGMSLGTAVIEAGIKSGSLITANHCNDQGKTLFVVPPHDIFDLRYGGNVALIRDGAVPLMSSRDIVYEYYPENRDKLSDKAGKLLESSDFINTEVYKRTGMGPARRKISDGAIIPQPPLPGTFGHKKKQSKKKAAETAPKTAEISRGLPELDGDKKTIAEMIMNAGRPVIPDEIAEKTNLNTSEVLSLLVDLELDGVVVCGAGGTYTIDNY